MQSRPIRFCQHDRHVIRSVDLRQVAACLDRPNAALAELDRVIDCLREMLANWPRKSA